jgi:hypothetical protein
VNPGDIITHAEMCAFEKMMLQRGMKFRAPPANGIILMSLRSNAPYDDAVEPDGTVIYEGHDEPKSSGRQDPKSIDQPRFTRKGQLTENGKFADWVDRTRRDNSEPAKFHVYESLRSGMWTFRGVYELSDYWIAHDGRRNVFKFRLVATDFPAIEGDREADPDSYEGRSRQIPTWIKQYVFKRDKGVCVICGSKDNLHFDHDLPFSKGGTSLRAENVRLLCARHNLSKGSKVE